jgi:carbamoyl-phosphate synthase small subunit
MSKSKAVLAIESGDIFFGESFGFKGERLGEVVFNTSMTGYQEILTDPSYKGQIIVMTEPHIGNVGVNSQDQESRQIFCEGFVVREASPLASSWRAREDLSSLLVSRRIPALTNVDTRRLTKVLRESGVMRGILSTLDFNPKSLLKKIKNFPEMTGQDLVKQVTCRKSYSWSDGEWNLSVNGSKSAQESYRVVAMDFGIKHNILKCLVSRSCKVSVVPSKTTA